MPVIGRRDEDRIDRFVLEDDPQILHLFRHGAFQFTGEQCPDFIRPVKIRITDVSDVAVGQTREFTSMRLSADAAADDRDGELFRGTDGRCFILSKKRKRQRSRSGNRSGNHDRVFEETTAGDVFHKMIARGYHKSCSRIDDGIVSY